MSTKSSQAQRTFTNSHGLILGVVQDKPSTGVGWGKRPCYWAYIERPGGEHQYLDAFFEYENALKYVEREASRY